MVNKLLLLTLTSTLATHGAFGMFNKKTTVNAEEAHAKAQEWATKLAAQAAKKTAATSASAAQRSDALPENIRRHIGGYFATRAWRNKLYQLAGSYSFAVCAAGDALHMPGNLMGNGSDIVTITNTKGRKNFTVNIWDINTAQLQYKTLIKEIRATATETCSLPAGVAGIIAKLAVCEEIEMPTAHPDPKRLFIHQVEAIAISQNYVAFCKHERSDYYGAPISRKRALILYDRLNNQHRIIAKFDSSFDLSPCMQISSDEQYIICSTDNSDLLMFERQGDGSWQQIYKKQHGLDLMSCRIQAIVFSQDNSRFVSLCWDNSIKIWDTKTGVLKQTLTSTHLTTFSRQPFHGALWGCAISNDNQIVAAACTHYSRPYIWHVATGEHLKIQDELKWSLKEASVQHVEISSDSKQVITHHDGGEQRIWDAYTGELLETIPGNEALFGFPYNPCITNAQDKRFIITRKNDQTVVVKMSIESINKLLQELSLEQLALVNELMLVRDKQVAKDQTKPLALPQEQLERFGTLPQFVQTALRINLNLVIPGLSQDKQVETKHIKEESKTS